MQGRIILVIGSTSGFGFVAAHQVAWMEAKTVRVAKQ